MVGVALSAEVEPAFFPPPRIPLAADNQGFHGVSLPDESLFIAWRVHGSILMKAWDRKQSIVAAFREAVGEYS